MNRIAEITLQALKEHDELGALKHYSRCLRSAFEAHPPPFSQMWYGELFRSHAVDAEWLANTLLDNAATEGWGASKLWQLAAKTHEERVSAMIRQHAMDESRHSKIYGGMLSVVFPGCVDKQLKDEIAKMSPTLKINDRPTPLPPFSPGDVLDNLLQMNVAEIRTLVNQMLARPIVLEFCPKASRSQVDRMLSTLMSDEAKHVGYTAKLLDEAMEGGQEKFIMETIHLRMPQFNEMTLREVSQPSTSQGGMGA